MSEVTNNENMRRYVHMALSRQASGGSSDSSAVPQMIVTGSVSDRAFSPDDGQPEFSDVYQHFMSGGVVVLNYDDLGPNQEAAEFHVRVISCASFDTSSVLFGSGPAGEIMWQSRDVGRSKTKSKTT